MSIQMDLGTHVPSAPAARRPPESDCKLQVTKTVSANLVRPGGWVPVRHIEYVSQTLRSCCLQGVRRHIEEVRPRKPRVMYNDQANCCNLLQKRPPHLGTSSGPTSGITAGRGGPTSGNTVMPHLGPRGYRARATVLLTLRAT